MCPVIIVSERPEDADYKTMLRALVSYNDAAGEPSGYEPVAILIRDHDRDETIGGLWGKVSYDWLFVELLFVPELLRRQKLGTQLMDAAGQLARERKCVGVWLETYGFQAPAFYQSLGYEVFGQLPDHARGSGRFFLRKMLAASV
ncbi:GNAT family N-acetyltransferase [Mesorhizobium sp. ORM16]|uniref:GNAT family N-acetyltransferase n=1 Tax=Mesorhizobium sp. ORM16 TaxID=3376989 RepID=UPI003857F183